MYQPFLHWIWGNILDETLKTFYLTTHGLIKQHNADKCNTFLGLMGLTCILICINKHCQEINLGKCAIIVHIHLPEVVFFLSLAVAVVPTLFELVQVNAYWFGAWKTQMFTMIDTMISLWSSSISFNGIRIAQYHPDYPSQKQRKRWRFPLRKWKSLCWYPCRGKSDRS